MPGVHLAKRLEEAGELRQVFPGPNEFLVLQRQSYLPALYECSTWPALSESHMSHACCVQSCMQWRCLPL